MFKTSRKTMTTVPDESKFNSSESDEYTKICDIRLSVSNNVLKTLKQTYPDVKVTCGDCDDNLINSSTNKVIHCKNCWHIEYGYWKFNYKVGEK